MPAAILNLLFLSILAKWSISGGSLLHHCKISFIYVNRRLSYCCLCKNWLTIAISITELCDFAENRLIFQNLNVSGYGFKQLIACH